MYTFNIDPTKNEAQFQNYEYIFVTLRGVFLALLIFAGSFLAPYLGCNFQKLLKEKGYTRYILLFLIIYFSINLVDPSLGNKENPFFVVAKSAVVFCTFILLNALDTTSIVFVLALFGALIFTSKYYNYFRETTNNIEEHKFIHDLLVVTQIVLSLCIVSVLALSALGKKNKWDILQLRSCHKKICY